ncbi:MAG: ACP S-malonyltransferase, partial [Elusimicrobia bacterium]|nr:ACP S-malonyltransferase [Elusimicrobiota bacterium]
MKHIACIFPGQGSQFPGMGKELYEFDHDCRTMFDTADRVLQRSLTAVMFNGTEEELRQTDNTQPAVFTVSCALFDLFRKRGYEPHAVAGHSLGEYSALYAAGFFDFEQGLRLVSERAKLIQSCSQRNPGSMSAVIGMDRNTIIQIIQSMPRDIRVEPVNVNAPGQTVVAGSHAALDEFEPRARSSGALKVIRLNVSGPFHSSLMRDAAHAMRDVLDKAATIDTRCPVVMNADAQPTQSREHINAKLVMQIDHPVLWEASIRKLIELNTALFAEIGPGKVLTGINRRIDKKIMSSSIDGLKSLDSFCTMI